MIRNTTIILVFVTLTLVLSLLFGPTDAMAAIEQCRAIVYERRNHETSGDFLEIKPPDNEKPSLDFTVFVQTVPAYRVDLENKISSVKVFGGAKLVLWWDEGYKGKAKHFSEDTAYVGDYWDDEFSSLKLFCPMPSVDVTTLDFGNLYLSDRDGAEAHNKDQSKTVTLTNNGELYTTLHWEITGVPSGVNISSTSGNLPNEPGILGFPNKKSTVKITVWLNPKVAVNSSFTITTSGGDIPITLKAEVYDTPVISQVAPALGSNNKVNVAINDSVTFRVTELQEEDLSFPEATIKGYQWEALRKGNTPPWDTKGSAPDSRVKDINLNAAEEWVVHVRVVDNNDVATPTLEIPVKVWERPIVADAPPNDSDTIDSSWFTDTYVGVVGQSVELVLLC